MTNRYRVSKVAAITMAIVFIPIGITVPVILVGLNLYWQLWLGLIIGVAVEIGVWFGWARGTYITIDGKDNIYNTFFFIKRDVVPLSNIISLRARRLVSDAATTSVWKIYRDENGKEVTKTLTNRALMKKVDFDAMIERIRRANPRIEIAEELLK